MSTHGRVALDIVPPTHPLAILSYHKRPVHNGTGDNPIHHHVDRHTTTPNIAPFLLRVVLVRVVQPGEDLLLARTS